MTNRSMTCTLKKTYLARKQVSSKKLIEKLTAAVDNPEDKNRSSRLHAKIVEKSRTRLLRDGKLICFI